MIKPGGGGWKYFNMREIVGNPVCYAGIIVDTGSAGRTAGGGDIEPAFVYGIGLVGIYNDTAGRIRGAVGPPCEGVRRPGHANIIAGAGSARSAGRSCDIQISCVVDDIPHPICGCVLPWIESLLAWRPYG